uniref:Uncharacterized protein AlNc14C33G3030 n=1 Tax=Albugo laibachii Nc14 TaxID=890382 RepID=F0W870_9STRA|nr:conserved hypothetical protein [Albugo laibachii Nc14]|eukprot:CCA17354.1 conserved hypothetical protein [Albugo laibachii Nc14]
MSTKVTNVRKNTSTVAAYHSQMTNCDWLYVITGCSNKSMLMKSNCHKAEKQKNNKRKGKHVPITSNKIKSRRKARKITTLFHRLTKELKEVEDSIVVNEHERQQKVEHIKSKIDEIGGQEAYQEASILSTKFHRTSKWIFQILTKHHRRPKSREEPLRVLEVGAINTQLLSCPWLAVRAIDLSSKHDGIEQKDFFTLSPVGDFQVVVSSMVLNCVPDPQSRGKMLQLYHQHLKPSGFLFIMIPLTCLNNSKYMTFEYFTSILAATGFRILETKKSPKIAFFCAEKVENTFSAKSYLPIKAVCDGRSRNEFAIALIP